ncbi:hypothetical protein GCM10008960_08070 [Deinococcus sedimenti]|uniref:ArsR family transcriptional regulator n=1 Tax=Deinococcus sedimenti TaxID=1867090 RepID=A0ABQ2RZF8_9DEIO|nr:hypothetical protein GCM10008960_08070 [Deinococcus sedimenti]
MVEVLLDHAKFRLLMPFMAAPQTIAAAAEVTGTPPTSLGYWVKRFVRLGLVREVGSQRPAVFEAVASEFIVDPSRVMPLEEMLAEVQRPAWNRMLQGYAREYQRLSPDWLLHFHVTPDGVMTRREVTREELERPGAPVAPRPLGEWALLRLSREDAAAFRERLSGVVQEFLGRSSEDEADSVYLVHVGVTRDPVHG